MFYDLIPIKTLRENEEICINRVNFEYREGILRDIPKHKNKQRKFSDINGVKQTLMIYKLLEGKFLQTSIENIPFPVKMAWEDIKSLSKPRKILGDLNIEIEIPSEIFKYSCRENKFTRFFIGIFLKYCTILI